MNCTKKLIKEYNSTKGNGFEAAPRSVESYKDSAVGTALTIYKKVVDISTKKLQKKEQIFYYGLNQIDYNKVQKKLKQQRDFLQYSYLYDRINKNSIPLKDLVISPNHSPNRYYSEIQNRINTLTKVAKQKGLKPLFMTLTLPSEYHQYKTTKQGKLISNPKYNGTSPKDAVIELTKMFSRLRHDRSLKELSKDQRIYFRVNEPHKDGTPHTHILLFIPQERIERIKKAFYRLFDNKGNDIQDDIKGSAAYIMKYINKTLPLSKQKDLTLKDQYLNVWYSKHRIIRFNSSKTLAPLAIYRLLYSRFSLYALTKLLNNNELNIYVALDTPKIMQIIDEFGDAIYTRSDNYNIVVMSSSFRPGSNAAICEHYSQNNDLTNEVR